MSNISALTGVPMPMPVTMVNTSDIPPLPMSYQEFTALNPTVDVVKPDKTEETHNLSWPQYHFVTSKAKFPAMVAGYGAGKTEAGVLRALQLKFKYPNQNVGYYLPTYGLIKSIVFPRIEEILSSHGYAYFLNESDKELTIYGMKGTIIFRTMDRPELIIGYEHGHAVVDELDTLKIDKAAEVWRKVVARNRQLLPDGSRNTIGVATTPEGFKFVYERWKSKPMKGSQIIKASTMSNSANLPEDYIDTLRDTYPDQMLEAYIEGEFVNLTQGSVYKEFDRVLNNCRTRPRKGETLHIGIDFNVGQMAAVVHVYRNGAPHAVDEFIGFLDTPALITAIKKKYVDIETPCKIIAYPDASGKNRKSNNAAATDIAQLKGAKFLVLAHPSNPFIRDRVAAFNKMIHKDGNGLYKVNVDRCPHLVEGLEKQAYDKNGEPDKTSGVDHVLDGGGYFIAYAFPIAFNRVNKFKLKGV